MPRRATQQEKDSNMSEKHANVSPGEPVADRGVVTFVYVLETGITGEVIGSHPAGGVRLRYQDGTESPEKYIPWEQVRMVE